MQSYYWYLALVVLSIMITAITYWKSRNKLMFALYFSAAGLVKLFEYFILICLKAYIYTPGFVQDKFGDSILGATVSDFFSIPSTAVLIAVFQLSWVWIIAISGMFAGIESLFLNLGIYKHYWYKTYYTFISLLMFYTIMKWWYKRLKHPHGRALTFVTLLAILCYIRIELSGVIFLFLKSGKYNVRWIEALGVPSFAINTPSSIFIAITFTFLIVFRAKLLWKVAAIVGFFVIDLILFKLHIMHVQTYWHFMYLILSNVLVLLIGQTFGNLLRKNEVSR